MGGRPGQVDCLWEASGQDLHQRQGWSLGRLRCGLVTHTGASRGSSEQVGMEPADTPGSGWQRAWEVCLQGAPGPGGQVPRGLAAASDPRVLEDSWAGCEVSSRGLPGGPSTRVLSPDLPPEPQVWGTFLVGAAACEALPVCWGARGEVRGGLGSGGGSTYVTGLGGVLGRNPGLSCRLLPQPALPARVRARGLGDLSGRQESRGAGAAGDS